MMKNSFVSTPIIYFGMVVASGTGTGHSQSTKATIDQLTKGAEVVAIGRVQEMKSEWNEAKSMIRTRVTVSVDEYVKGGSGPTIEIFVPGGEVGSVGEFYTHMPKFSRDEYVVVFAEKDNKGRYRISGGSAGKYTVERDGRTGKQVVANQKPLDELKAEIRKVE